MSASLYTGGGDAGETSLAGGSRVSKDSLRVRAYGAVDEAGSHVGLARAGIDDPVLDAALAYVQHRLMSCAARLANPEPSTGDPAVTATDTEALERLIDLFAERSPALDGFVLSAGCEAAARLHVARSIVRRAERDIVALASETAVDEHILRFVNRLSDLLFAAARYANALDSTPDALWDPEAGPPAAT